MRIRFLPLAVLLLVTVPGCDDSLTHEAVTPLADGQADAQESPGDDAPPNGPGAATSGDAQTAPESTGGDGMASRAQTAIAAAGTAASALTKSLAAILPTKDIQPLLEGSMGLPACPTLDVAFDSNTVLLTFGYGDGCHPPRYTSPILAGAVDGKLFASVNSFDLKFRGLEVNHEPLAGAVTGALVRGTGTVRFIMNLALALAGEMRLTGSATIEFNESTGVMVTRNAATTLVTSSNETIGLSFENLVTDPAATGSFDPTSGSATATWIGDPPGSGQSKFTVQFSGQAATAAKAAPGDVAP